MELAGRPEDDRNAGYIDEYESEIEYSDLEEGDWDIDSSDEEGKWKFLHEKFTGASSSCAANGDAEFEKSMDKELVTALTEYIKSLDDETCANDSGDKVVPSVDQGIMASFSAGQESNHDESGKPPAPATTTSEDTKTEEFYDDIYFGSSSDEGVEESSGAQRNHKRKRKMRKLTNDELLYDPDIDRDNERWIHRQRLSYHNVRESQKLEHQKVMDCNSTDPGSPSNKGTTKPPKSDAILSCPACMTTLCIDCQRHAFYKNQYRAMFVLNCSIARDELLKQSDVKESKKQQRKRKKSRNQEEDLHVEQDTGPYHPVKCSVCSTEVAVYDTDDVFHFFNVLPSAS